MAYAIDAHAEVRKDLERIPDPMRSRLRKAINNLAENPRPNGVVKLSGYTNLYRLRVGDYRIAYFIHDRRLQIVVVAAVARGRAYEILRKRLGK